MTMIHKIKKKLKDKLTVKEIYTEQIPLLSGKLLEGRTALITGGGGYGIGCGIARAFVNQGAEVIITGRNEKRLKDTCEELNADALRVDYIVWDHSEIEGISEHLDKAFQKFGPIDILVNNAGYHGNQDFFTVTEKDYDNTFDVNVKNVFFLSQKLSQHMIAHKLQGNILNISSASAMKPAWSPYEISKWACRGFTRGLARELAPYGITVNGIAPGPTATRMSHWQEGDSITWPSIPKGRMALPEEIGNLAAYLCSDLGRMILGETVFCDGGSGTLTVNK